MSAQCYKCLNPMALGVHTCMVEIVNGTFENAMKPYQDRLVGSLSMMLDGTCCDNGSMGQLHRCQKQPSGDTFLSPPRFGAQAVPGVTPGIEAMREARKDPSKDKGGRPKGFDGTRSKMPSALAQAFKKAGLDWKTDFALAIKGNKRERIGMWMKLIPYLITTSSKGRMAGFKRWKGRPSKAAIKALDMLEGTVDNTTEGKGE